MAVKRTALGFGEKGKGKGVHGMKTEQPEKPKRGRPSAYKPEYAKQAEKLALLGATDQEIADFFEVSVATVYRWKHDHDDFCEALKVGKEVCDNRVERSLFQRAIGYEQDEVKIFMPANAAEPVYAPFRAKIAPDTTAAIFWLKNRRPDLWRDKQEQHHTGSMTLVQASPLDEKL